MLLNGFQRLRKLPPAKVINYSPSQKPLVLPLIYPEQIRVRLRQVSAENGRIIK